MEELEIKHLAPYLPYGLLTDKGLVKGSFLGGIGQRIFVESALEGGKVTTQICISEIKPILRPISSMVGENGFIMFELLGLDFTTQDNDVFVSEEGRVYFEDESNFNVPHLKYETIEKLFENHFDVFGLIEKGLAININTLGK